MIFLKSTDNKRRRAIFALIAAIALLAAAPKADAATGEVAVNAKYPVLPVVPGILQELVITVSAEGEGVRPEYEVEIGVLSQYGVLLATPSGSRSCQLKARPGEPLSLQYRWTGAIPTEDPVEETIFVRIPELEAEDETAFSVGMDLQVKEIVLPTAVASGAPSGIEVVLYDAYHPEEDVATTTATFGIVPELRIELISTEQERALSYAVDPVLAKFFERREARPLEIAYPSGDGKAFKPGLAGKDYELGYTWRSTDGRQPQIAPPTPGEYRVRAFLRANTGGATIREYTSPPFEVEGKKGIGHGLPYLVEATLEILSGLDAEMAVRAGDEVRRGNPADIAETAATLGVYLQNVARPSAIKMLGRYVSALTASGLPAKEVNEFTRQLLKGYGDYGVLIVSKGGIASWNATDLHKIAYSLAPKGHVYEDSRYVVIPFQLGDDFRLDLRGSGSGGVSLWKIIPLGINAKSYPQGKWHKSIAVHTGQLTPPPPNKVY